VLEWAAGQERVLLTHDSATMSDFAYEHVSDGLRMPGVFMVPETWRSQRPSTN
jgi:hypothetical protein